MVQTSAESEKSSVALNSVIAAAFVTALKIVVGFWSGSMGILAEAAHSGLDLMAAMVTYVAVRTASRPADAEHHYGHGKVENFSALVETLLLLGTCGWIIYESTERLLSKNVQVNASIWTFAVMIVSIIVDVSRSRMLYRAAAKHRSQALEADALHFSTDVWSSAVVIVGLLCVRLAGAFPSLGFLLKADAVAALLVAAIVVGVSLKLGIRTVQALLDAAPTGMTDKVLAVVQQVPGVQDCHALRLRYSGPRTFVDMHVTLDGNQSLETAHEITERIEHAVNQILPDADVTVHPEPPHPPAAAAGQKPN